MFLRLVEFIADRMIFWSKFRIIVVLQILAILIMAGLWAVRGFFVGSGTENLKCNGKTCNVILIVSDALSAQHMSVYGYERDTTPYIKEYFENNGVIFDSASSPASWTLPSFASMFRSRYPSQIKFEELAKKKDPSTFVDVLRKNGVEVAALVDKDQLIKESIRNVFDEREVLPGGSGEARFLSADQWLTERVKSDKDNPFFMMIHDWTVHDPYTPPETYQKMFGEPEAYQGPVTRDHIEVVKQNGFESEEQKQKFIRRYDQGVRHFDDLVKNFIENLEQKVLDSSIIIITSDHGEGFDEHGYFYHGAHIYDEFVHIPMLWKLPDGTVSSPERIKTPVSLMDISTTALSIFGLGKPEGYLGNNLLSLLDGKDLAEWITKSELGRFELSLGEVRSFDQFNESTLKSTVFADSSQFALKSKNWKLIKTLSSIEIFDISRDPKEKQNMVNSWQDLGDSDREVIQRLLSEAEKIK